MPINEERLNKMKELGLTDYQARVYLTLLDLGVAKASKIPTISRVPRTRIYSTMNQLHEKGLVEIIPESPIKYKPVPMSDYLDTVADTYKKKADGILERKEDLVDEFSVKAIVEAEESGGFEAIYGRRNVRNRLNRMYEEAGSEILSIGTVQSPTRIFRSRLPTVEEKFKHGVDIKYAFPIDASNLDHAQVLSQYAEIKSIDLNLSMYFLVVDSKQALLCHPIPPDESFLKGDDIAIWTDDCGIAEALRNIAVDILDQGHGIEEVDLTTPLLNSARSFIKLLGIQGAPVFVSMATSIGEGLSDNFKGTTPAALVEELSEFWKENSLGEIEVIKKKPLTIRVSHFLRCGVDKKKKGQQLFCRFVEAMLGRIVDNKLEGKAKINKCTCLGERDSYCNVSFQIG
jgi:sugar-specific transcriptional regulator TrmB/predicted hydrocarbon binding protein